MPCPVIAYDSKQPIQQMSGETVPQGMAVDPLDDARRL